MAAPVLESSNSAVDSGGSATSLSIPVPSGIAVGDLLVIGLTTDQIATPSGPSGWTREDFVQFAGLDDVYTYWYKIAVQADTNAISYSVSWSAGARAAGWIARISGADTTNPIAAHAEANSSGTAPDSPNTSISPNRDVLGLSHFGQEGKTVATAAPSGYTLHVAVATSGGGSPASHCAVGLASLQQTNSSGQNPGAWTGSSDDWGAVTTLIQEPQTTSVTVNATTIACTSTVPAATVDTSFPVTVNATTIATVATTPAVTVSTGSGVTVSPTAIAGTSSVPASSIRVNETLLVAVILGTTTTPTATVSTGTGVTVSPAVIATAATTPAVTVTAQTDLTVSPASIAAVAATPAPTITQGTGVTVNAVPVDALAAIPAVTVAVNDGASPATIAATAAVPAVTVSVIETVNVATIAATSTVPELAAVGGALEIAPDTIAGTSTVPSPSFTLGQGVTVAPAAVAGTSTAGASVAGGQGSTVAPLEVRVLAAIPDLGLKRLVVLPTNNILPQIDVVPYHVSDPARNLARFRTPGAKGRNVFILTNGSVTTRQPGDPASISRTIYGGHESPDDLTSTELDALVAAGYSVEVR